MKRSVVVFVILLALVPSIQAQRTGTTPVLPFPIVKAESVGLSSERLARINTMMQGYVDRREIAGAITLIARHGKVAHFETFGYRDVEAKAPMTSDTIFRQASMTKPIVAVAVLTLLEEGRLHLNDPISKWLPEFKDMQVVQPVAAGSYKTVPARTPITVRHLLTHTSGLQGGDGLLQSEFDKIAPRSVPNDTLQRFVKRLAPLPLSFEPGTAWNYGGTGIGLTVAGRVVEVIAGLPLDQFLTERIFRPLKMDDTYFYLPENKLARFAATYRPGANNKIELEEAPGRDSQFFRERTFFSGHGGLVSTASDYLRFQQMLLNGGELAGVRILSRKSVEVMSSNHVAELYMANQRGYGFGLAVRVMIDLGATGQLGSKGMFGWTGAYNTESVVDPAEDMIWMVMSQLSPNSQLTMRRDFQTLVYQALIDAPPRPPAK